MHHHWGEVSGLKTRLSLCPNQHHWVHEARSQQTSRECPDLPKTLTFTEYLPVFPAPGPVKVTVQFPAHWQVPPELARSAARLWAEAMPHC